MSTIAQRIRQHSGLIRYTALNYVDKGLAFGVPLIVLWLFDDRHLYNEIEYIYSIGAILAIVIELGVRNYSLYAYKESSDRERLAQQIKSIFLLQLSVLAALSLVGLAIGSVLSGALRLIYFFIAIRALFVYLISFFSIFYRLQDKPSLVFALSLTANGATIAILYLMHTWNNELALTYFFAAQAALVFGFIISFVRKRTDICWRQTVEYGKRAIVYAWPIILNVLLIMGINSYGRIYARNFLSEGEMFQIAYVQRIALIIHLAHMSAVGYLSKRVFIEVGNAISGRILGLYSVMLGVSVAGVMGALLLMRMVGVGEGIGLSLISFLIVAYTVLWCFVSFFELYLNKRNRTRYVLGFSSAGAAAFVICLLLIGSSGLTAIALSMVIGMAVNLTLAVSYLSRNRATTSAAVAPRRTYEPSAV